MNCGLLVGTFEFFWNLPAFWLLILWYSILLVSFNLTKLWSFNKVFISSQMWGNLRQTSFILRARSITDWKCVMLFFFLFFWSHVNNSFSIYKSNPRLCLQTTNAPLIDPDKIQKCFKLIFSLTRIGPN